VATLSRLVLVKYMSPSPTTSCTQSISWIFSFCDTDIIFSTGQNPNSATALAEKMLAHLTKA